jgi:bifunctional non-homologous end joining protein LigD
MALKEYRRKRDFTITPEPPPEKVSSRKKQLAYLIQKHDATRLHYDFRLELDGVLLSWAVTRGPSLNPADKRLAVRTEDHPFSYGDFEGTIPKGQYGGGTVMLWDKGTWEPKGGPHAGMKKGHLSFTLHGEKLKGDWDLIRMRGDAKKENWLLIKAKDSEARTGSDAAGFLDESGLSVKTGRSMDAIAGGEKASGGRNLAALMKTYDSVQLATLVDAPPEGDGWVHEIKFDGYRLLGFLADGAVCLRTRNGLDWTAKFPSISAAMEKLKAKDAVLDMEAVVLDEKGRSTFQGLQAALGDGGRRERIVAFVFDLLHLDGRDWSKQPLSTRKETLAALLEKSKADKALVYSEHITGSGAKLLEKSCGLGLEGIVSKRAGAPYTAGRDKLWLKSKCIKRQEFIIVGYSSAHKGERALGALYLGYHDHAALKYAGKVGTGFTMQSARDLIARLAPLATDKPVLTRAGTKGLTAGEYQTVHWVSPKLLCEVAFTEWTDDGRIRHPSFQGLREDKSASEVKMETPAKATNAKNANAKNTTGLELDGITVTHPDRVISETGHITKGELAEYHSAVAAPMLAHIARHPVSLLRCPSGIGGQCFYQRNPGKGLGEDVHPFKFRHKGKNYEYLYIETPSGLLSLIQMGAIEIHPWGAGIDNIDFPDRLIFDLDPAPDLAFEAVKLAAHDLKHRLKHKGLESMPKVTGGKGIHVTVPLAARDEWPAVREFAESLAAEMVAAAPTAYVATMTKTKRTGKIFIDYFRNDYTATAIADYSVRAREGAPVAVPLEWRELEDLESGSQFTIKDVLKRLKKKPPQWPEPQRLPAS